jgi:hypothetical protein
MPINAVITALPANGGSALTKIQARNNGGTAYDLTTSPAIGTYATTANIGDTVEIRAVNAVDANPNNWSAAKTLSSNPELVPNANFDTTDTWAGTSGTTAFSISGGMMTITNRGDSFLDGVAAPVVFAAGVYDVKIVVDAILAGSGGARVKINDFDIPALTPLTVAGTYTAQYTSPSAATRNLILSTSSATTQVRLAAVSIRLAS